MEKTIMTVRLPFLQVFGYFYIFYIFSHIFGVYDPIFKIFSVIHIKIKFHIVWRKQLWQSDCLFAGFSYFYIFFTFFSISLVFMVRFPKFFQLYISTSNFLLFRENNLHFKSTFTYSHPWFFCASLLMDVVILVF